MEQELKDHLTKQDAKLEAIYQSVEKTRKYFLYTLITSLVFFLVPLIGLLFAIPFLLNTLSQTASLMNGL